MDKLHTLIISPKYRPAQDGLSDYVYFFFNQLRSHKLKINLITSSDDEIINFCKSDKDIFPIIKKWDFWGPLELIRFIREKKPQYILIEYVPHMYGRAGVNIFFPFYIIFISWVLRKRVVLMAHELHYPFQNDIKTGFLFFWHIWNLALLSFASSTIFTTTENFIKILSRIPFNKNKTHLLAVGPNIGRIDGHSAIDKRKDLVLFGSMHPSRNTYLILKQLTEYFKINHNHPFHLHIIGSSKDEILNCLQKESPVDQDILFSKTTFHGKLSEEDVSILFSKSHFSINHYVDGISCRRGSAISAMNLGLPIITNFNERSDELFLNRPNVLMVNNNQFSDTLKKIENMSNEEYISLRIKSFQFVDQNFCWDVICKRYLKYISI